MIEETTRRDVLAFGYQLTQINPAQPEPAIATIDAVTAQLQAHSKGSPLGSAAPQAEQDSIPPPGNANDSAPSRPEKNDVGQQDGDEYGPGRRHPRPPARQPRTRSGVHYGLFRFEGVDGRRRVGAWVRVEVSPRLEVPTPPIWKTSTCPTLPSLALT